MDIQLQNQLKRLVEVTALVGLSLHAHREAKVVSELEKFAFPDELAAKINKDPEYIIIEESCYCGDDDCEGGCDDNL
jgi:hypothetical protein